MKHYRCVTALALCCAVLGAGCSARKSDQFRQEGDTLFQLGEFTKAAGAYQRAEEVNPNNALAKLGRGRCFLVGQDYDAATEQFRGAIAIDSDLEAAYAELIRLQLKQGDPDDAEATAKQFEAVNGERGGITYAFVLHETGRATEAVAYLTRIRDQFPNSVDLRVGLAVALLSGGEPGKAEVELKAVLDEMASDSVVARLLLVDAYQAQGKVEEILAEYERLTEEHPEDIVTKLALSQSLLKVGRVKDAEGIARSVYENQPEFGWANYVLGACLLEQEQFGDARALLKKAAEALPDNALVAGKLALAVSGRREPLRPVAVPSGVVAPPRVPTQARSEEIELEDWRGLWKQAALKPLLENRAEYLKDEDPEVAETLVMAAVFLPGSGLVDELRLALPADSQLHGYFDALASGKATEFFEHMKQWKETEASRIVLRENARGVGLASMGARSFAVAALSESLAVSPEYGVTLFNIAQVFRAANMPRVAAKTLERLLVIAENNPEVHNLLYASLRQARVFDEAQTSAEMTYSLFPNRADSALNLAQAYVDNGLFDLAGKVLTGALETRHDEQKVQLALGHVLLHAREPEEAARVLDNVPETGPDAVKRAVTTAFAMAALGRWEEVGTLLDTLENVRAKDGYKFLRVAAFLNAGSAESARALFDTVDPATPLGREEAVIRAALGMPASLEEASEITLAEGLRQDPTVLARYVFAAACLRMPYYNLALHELAAVHERQEGSASVAALMIRCMKQVTPKETREEEARALAAQYPTAGRVSLALAQLLNSLGDTAGEREALVAAGRRAPDDPEVWLSYGHFLEQQDEYAAATGAYDQVVRLLPDDIAGNNNLAYCLLMSGGDLEKALAHVKAAVARVDANPLVLHTLGLVHLRLGNLEESASNFKLALILRPADPTFLLDYGQLLIKQGMTEDGLHHIRLALTYSDQMGLSFTRRAEANQVLSGR